MRVLDELFLPVHTESIHFLMKDGMVAEPSHWKLAIDEQYRAILVYDVAGKVGGETMAARRIAIPNDQ